MVTTRSDSVVGEVIDVGDEEFIKGNDNPFHIPEFAKFEPAKVDEEDEYDDETETGDVIRLSTLLKICIGNILNEISKLICLPFESTILVGVHPLTRFMRPSELLALMVFPEMGMLLLR